MNIEKKYQDDYILLAGLREYVENGTMLASVNFWRDSIQDFKEFDVIKLSVRCYSSGNTARCFLVKEKGSDYYIISLEENFESDGGLSIYSRYAMGREYKYRDMSKDEIITLPYFIYTMIKGS